ncbi:hypothetical protein BJ980_002643 [Nocardioides daedukensis]|uniref:DUF559 domain-containing protein n=1 Tax=Nocardioides daedukensis TaxID=634462 RepID=A0A7Y9S5C1_9ACTN|nr:hypothetical protein [Nocardioides daedukensis]NYG59720.1 hypothetical protein [Nocardioides daedukensis]
MELPVDPLADQWLDLANAEVPPAPRIVVPRIVVPVPVDPAGIAGPTRGRSRGPHWRQSSPNRFVPAHVDGTVPAQRIAEVLQQAPSGVVTGWASLHLAGARWFEGRLADGRQRGVPVALGRGVARRSIPGGVVTRAILADDEVVLRHGIRCTGVHRAIFDEVVLLDDVRRGVEAIEMAFHAELTSRARLGAWLSTSPRRVGNRLVRQALELALEGAESPQETKMHLVWRLDAGLPTPMLNQNIFDLQGRFLARVDLLDPVAGVVGEYDGESHRATRSRRNDVRREGDLRRAGLEFFSVVAGELARPEHVVQRMRWAREKALSSALASKRHRAWALTPRNGVRPMTLDERIERRRHPR